MSIGNENNLSDVDLGDAMNKFVEVVPLFHRRRRWSIGSHLFVFDQIGCQDHHTMSEPIVRFDELTTFIL